MKLRRRANIVRNLVLASISLAGMAAIALGGAQGQTVSAPPAAEPAAQQPVAPQPPASAAPAAPTVPAPPPVNVPPELSDKIMGLSATVEGAEKSLSRMKDADDDIGRLRNDVEAVIARSTEVADDLRPRLADIRRQIEKLGPPPGKDQPPESAAVTGERARLNNEAAALDGAIKTLEVTWVRARQTIDRITDLRLQMFTRSLMERRSSPLFPGLWTDVIRDTPQVSRLLSYIASDWLGNASRRGLEVMGLLLAAFGVYAAGRALVWRWTRPVNGARRLSFFERAATASWVAPVRALPAVAAALVVYAGLDSMGLLYYPSARIAEAVLRAVLMFSVVAALIATVLAPKEPARRLVNLSDRSASRVSLLLQAMTAIYSADLALTSLSRVLYLPLSISVVQSLVASLAFAGLLIGILLTPFESETAAAHGAEVSREHPRWIKYPLWLAAASIIVAALLGYVALSRFAAQQIVMTGVVALTATLLFLAIRAFTREPGEAAHPVGQMLEARFGLDAPRRQQLARLTEAALTLSLGILALPVLLLQWGFSTAEIRDWLKAALFGFEVGHFRISLARILIGIVLFTALLFLTRLFQRWLRQAILVQPRVDAGVAHSIDTASGYAGTILAALIAISYAGLDVTNLAIVAGALSVGIGFGLQSIVNNFVSGLILLIERPIKVGDWIVVGGEQGNVRSISVRSTEIETFDKASLIVPNSELIAGRVLNWTHRNSIGRLVIKVSTAATADPKSVCALLEEVAAGHPQVLAAPRPLVSFDGFNASELSFTVRVHVGDINSGLGVSTSLRTAVFERFREMGIQMAPAPATAPG
jgi:small-conductance mechanosensitive channel